MRHDRAGDAGDEATAEVADVSTRLVPVAMPLVCGAIGSVLQVDRMLGHTRDFIGTGMDAWK